MSSKKELQLELKRLQINQDSLLKHVSELNKQVESLNNFNKEIIKVIENMNEYNKEYIEAMTFINKINNYTWSSEDLVKEYFNKRYKELVYNQIRNYNVRLKELDSFKATLNNCSSIFTKTESYERECRCKKAIIYKPKYEETVKYVVRNAYLFNKEIVYNVYMWLKEGLEKDKILKKY